MCISIGGGGGGGGLGRFLHLQYWNDGWFEILNGIRCKKVANSDFYLFNE